MINLLRVLIWEQWQQFRVRGDVQAILILELNASMKVGLLSIVQLKDRIAYYL